MILEVGKAGKARFVRGIKKTNIFECGPNGLVLEREKNIITLYVTNHRCSEIYCVIPLGGNEILKKNKFMGVAYSSDIMLIDGGDIMVVVDFARKKVAVNKPEITVTGKAGHGAIPQNAVDPLNIASHIIIAVQRIRVRGTENVADIHATLPCGGCKRTHKGRFAAAGAAFDNIHRVSLGEENIVVRNKATAGTGAEEKCSLHKSPP